MRYAIAHLREGDERIAAEDVRRLFPGPYARGIRFTCPYCDEPVVPAALEPGGTQSPHFRHKGGSEKAHLCEAYERGYYSPEGSSSRVSAAAPLPMYISPLEKGQFTLLIGLTPVDDASIEEFQRNRSQLIAGSKYYIISRSRFPEDRLVRLEYGLPDSLRIDDVTVMNAPSGLQGYWGRPEPMAQGVCFFAMDGRTGTGSRIALGGKVFMNEEFYCVASPIEARGLAAKFSTIKRVGEIASAGVQKLYVYTCVIQGSDRNLRGKTEELQKLGYSVVARSQRPPRIVWPPCARAYGEYQPLFQRSAIHLLVDKSPFGLPSARSVRVASANRFGTGSVKQIEARTVGSNGRASAVIEPQEGRTAISVFSLFAASDSTVVLNGERISADLLKRGEALPRVERSGSVLAVHALVPYDVELLRRGGAQVIKVPDELLANYVVDEGSSPMAILVRVTLPGFRPRSMVLWTEVAIDATKYGRADIATEPPDQFRRFVSVGEMIAKRRLSQTPADAAAYAEVTLSRLGYRDTLGDLIRRRMGH